MRAAQAAFDDADYRWAAELLNHLVFAEPSHREAKTLLAATYDQSEMRIYVNGQLDAVGVVETTTALKSAPGMGGWGALGELSMVAAGPASHSR